MEGRDLVVRPTQRNMPQNADRVVEIEQKYFLEPKDYVTLKKNAMLLTSECKTFRDVRAPPTAKAPPPGCFLECPIRPPMPSRPPPGLLERC